MELSKSSAVKLTIVSVAAAVACLACVGLLGVSFREYWRFHDNRNTEEAALAKLQENISSTESAFRAAQEDNDAQMKKLVQDLATTKAELDRLGPDTARYVALTNRIAEAEAMERELEASIGRCQENCGKKAGEVLRLQGELSAISNKLNEANISLSNVRSELGKLEVQKKAFPWGLSPV